MTDKEFVRIFRKDNNMNKAAWKRFCRQYANRDISTVIKGYDSVYSVKNKTHISCRLRHCLRSEISKTVEELE